jgi:hypothetical protein
MYRPIALEAVMTLVGPTQENLAGLILAADVDG